MGVLRQKFVRGAIWAFLERFGTQLVQFVVSMILARLLTPDDYGSLALLMIFVVIAMVLSDSGFGQALVQKKDADACDYNTVFFLSLGLSVIIYFVLYFTAPLIAVFFRDPSLEGILKVYALSIVFTSLGSVQTAELTKKMLFHLSFKISIVQCIVMSGVGVCLAYCGFGVWSLVWSHLVGSVAGLFLRWVMVAWRPRLEFSVKSMSQLYKYGWKLTLSSILETSFQQFSRILIGKFYTKADLAFVNRGSNIASLPMDAVNGTISRVSFPALVQIQDDSERIRRVMRMVVQYTSYLVFPIMMCCAVSAREIVLVVYGEQWLSAVPYVRLACLEFALWPMHTVNLNAILATGRSDIILTLSIIKKILNFTIVLVMIPHGVWWMMAMLAFVSGPLSLLVNIWPNRRLLGYGLCMMMRDILPCGVACVIAGAAGIALRICCSQILDTETISGNFLLLAMESIVFAIVYLVLSIYLCKEIFSYYYQAIMQRIKYSLKDC